MLYVYIILGSVISFDLLSVDRIMLSYIHLISIMFLCWKRLRDCLTFFGAVLAGPALVGVTLPFTAETLALSSAEEHVEVVFRLRKTSKIP